MMEKVVSCIHHSNSTQTGPLDEKYRERYAEWISNNIIDGIFAGLRGYKSAILVGGGALLIEDILPKWYEPEKLLKRKKHPTTKKVFPVDFNAVGGLRLALNRIQQTQAT